MAQTSLMQLLSESGAAYSSSSLESSSSAEGLNLTIQTSLQFQNFRILTSIRAPGLMKVTAILSIIAGLILIGLYSWRIRQIDDYTHQSHLREQIAGLVPNVLSDLFSGRGMSSLGDTFLGILGGGKSREQQQISQRQDKAAFAPNFSEGYKAFDHLSVYGKLSHDRCSSRIQVPVGSSGNTIGVLLFDYCNWYTKLYLYINNNLIYLLF